jgi:hypothetical protein
MSDNINQQKDKVSDKNINIIMEENSGLPIYNDDIYDGIYRSMYNTIEISTEDITIHNTSQCANKPFEIHDESNHKDIVIELHNIPDDLYDFEHFDHFEKLGELPDPIPLERQVREYYSDITVSNEWLL